MEKALAIIGGVLLLASIGLAYYFFYCKKKKKIMFAVSKGEKTDSGEEFKAFNNKDLKFLGILSIAFVIGGLLANLGAMLWPRDGEGHAWINSGIPSLGIIGTILFFIGLIGFILGFYIHFYLPDFDKKQAKYAHIALYVGLAVAVIGFLLAAEGISRSAYFSFPLYSVISIGNLTIAFYGILIVFGACVAYGLADHRVYQYTGEHGLLDSTFLVAFPSGIICARIGYVIGNWDLEFADRVASGDWTCIFAIWEGGLTILGGAIGGIVVGCLWFWWRHKDLGPRFALEVVVPGILLAQAIGRWGNFFNQEVYGAAVDNLNYLPYWIFQNMLITTTVDGVSVTAYRVPLFLIEGTLNVIGYFFIWYGLRRWLKKWWHWSDSFGFYLMWYGIVRIILEPLRDSNFNMGNDGMWSIIWAGVYIGLGVLWLFINRLIDYIRKRRGLPEYVPHYNKPKALEKKAEKPVKKQEKKLEEKPTKKVEDDDDEWDD